MMALDAELRALMIDEIDLEAFVSRDVFGAPSYAASVAVQCRIEGTNKKVFARTRTDPQYMERIASGRIYLPPTPVITINDRVTLPDGSQPVILSVEANSDETGPNHQVVWV